MIHAVPAHSMIYEGKTGADGKVVLTGIPYGKATVEAGGYPEYKVFKKTYTINQPKMSLKIKLKMWAW